MNSMNGLNRKLKERREKINLHKSHEKTKIYRKFKQDKKKENQNQNQSFTNKVEKFQNSLKLIDEYNKRIGIEDLELNQPVTDKSNNFEKKDGNQKNQNDNLLNKKRIRTENELKEKTKNKFDSKNENRLDNKKGNKINIDVKGEDKIKKTQQEREEEKQKKMEHRKKTFKKFNKKTKFGQPIMKFRVENLLSKIKSKIKKGEF